jgi:hypothetical protein
MCTLWHRRCWRCDMIPGRDYYYDEKLSIASKKQGLPMRRGGFGIRKHVYLPWQIHFVYMSTLTSIVAPSMMRISRAQNSLGKNFGVFFFHS